jgi:hypothetical protein
MGNNQALQFSAEALSSAAAAASVLAAVTVGRRRALLATATAAIDPYRNQRLH